MIDGDLCNSCLVPVMQVEGATIVTIEGAPAMDRAARIQQSFLDHGGAQCGICTPGMILASVALLARHPDPTMEQIREGLAGNLCRCTGYMRIFESVRQAALGIKEAAGGK
jgi:carbon-monoxide dehydrogenase small subunit